MAGIYHRSGDGLVKLELTPYDAEDDLQRLLAVYPELLSGDRDGSGQRWLLIKREAGVPSSDNSGDRWSVDHLFVDQDALPTLVEVKRSSDTRIRREVVGQMLDYAANASSYWQAADLRRLFEERSRDSGRDPSEELDELTAGEDPDAFWDRVESNLRAGNLRLVFAADEIPDELLRVIEFLNEQLKNTEVIALEVRQYVGDGDRQTLIPTLLGATQAAAATKNRPNRRTLDEAGLIAGLRELAPEAVHAAERVLAWCHDFSPALTFSMGRTSIAPGLKTASAYCFPFLIYSTGWVEAGLQYMNSAPYPPFHLRSRRLELIKRLNALPFGEPIGVERAEKRPNCRLTDLADPAILNGFLEIYEWVLREALESGIGLANLEEAREEQARERGELTT